MPDATPTPTPPPPPATVPPFAMPEQKLIGTMTIHDIRGHLAEIRSPEQLAVLDQIEALKAAGKQLDNAGRVIG